MADDEEDEIECVFDGLNHCSTHKGGAAFLCSESVQQMGANLDRTGPIKPGETSPTIRCWTCHREFKVTLEPKATSNLHEAERYTPAGLENCPFCMSVLIEPSKEK